MSDLFRKEAVNSQRQSLWGSTLLVQPVSYKIFTAVLLLVVLSLIVYLILNDYNRKETVRGYLVPDKGVVKVYAPQNGKFHKIWVTEGEQVRKGQPLFQVDTEQHTRGGDLNQLVLQELEKQKESLKQQIDLQYHQEASRRQQLEGNITMLEEQLRVLERQQDLQGKLLSLQQEKYDRYQVLLSKHLIAEADISSLKEERLRQQQRQQELGSLRLNHRQKLKKLRHDLEALPTVTAQKVIELKSSLSSLNRQSIEAGGRAHQIVHAPVSGRVTYLSAREGKFANHQLPVLAILPEGAKLMAELYVPTRSIGFVESGMAVRLRYDAYPYQRFGSYAGNVSNYSQAVMDPREISAPVGGEEPVYRVIVDMESQSVMAYGKELMLQPGLMLEADVIIERRSLFEWLLEPLYSLKGRV